MGIFYIFHLKTTSPLCWASGSFFFWTGFHLLLKIPFHRAQMKLEYRETPQQAYTSLDKLVFVFPSIQVVDSPRYFWNSTVASAVTFEVFATCTASPLVASSDSQPLLCPLEFGQFPRPPPVRSIALITGEWLLIPRLSSLLWHHWRGTAPSEILLLCHTVLLWVGQCQYVSLPKLVLQVNLCATQIVWCKRSCLAQAPIFAAQGKWLSVQSPRW